MIREKIKNIFIRYKDEFLIAGLSFVIAGFMLYYVQSSGLVLVLEQQFFNLNSSRLVSDSLTPGIGNSGGAYVLLHTVMAPFSAVDSIYYSGLPGALALVFFLSAGGILLYRISFMITSSRPLGFVSALIFLLNPYALYFAVTPMPWILLFANLLFAAYFMVVGFRDGSPRPLFLGALFVFLASLSAPEGLMSVPIYLAAVAGFFLKKEKRFGIRGRYVFLGGLLCIAAALLSAWIFPDLSLLADSEASAVNIIPENGNAPASVQHLLNASYYMIGRILVIFSLASFFSLLLFPYSRRYAALTVLLLVASPFLAVLVGSIFSSPSMAFPGAFVLEGQEFQNFQYGFLFLLFVSLSPVFFLGALREDLRRRYGYGRIKNILEGAGAILLLALSFWQFNRIVFMGNFEAVRNDASFRASSRQESILADTAEGIYDFGQVFCTREGSEQDLFASRLPLKKYTNESNGDYYLRTMDSPWLFARWVLMKKNSGEAEQSADQIADRWESSESFNSYYTLVAENYSAKIYKVNEDKVRSLADEADYEISLIPSLRPDSGEWNPDKAYEDLGAEIVLANAVQSSEVQTALMGLYVDKMKEGYQNGYLAVDGISGNSETQSYILMQAMLSEDRETFDRAWRWTKENIQRSEDHLFAWKFNIENGRAAVSDRNPATDADEDIAYALLRAGEKWSREDYIAEARLVINGIWDYETAEYGGSRYVLAGNWANSPESLTINPSYFSPFAYRLFARYDNAHNWNGLVNDGYAFLERASQENLERGLGLYLPPDWILINKRTGALEPFNGRNFSYKHSYDAFRVFWRVAADHRIHSDARSRNYLSKVEIFSNDWRETGKVRSIFEFSNGSYAGKSILTAMAGPLSVLSVTDPQSAYGIVRTYYGESGTVVFRPDASFYERSWYWFGLYLWSGGGF